LDSELRHFLAEQTKAFGVSPADVVLEFTERSTASQQKLADALRQLERAGFRVYLDDFGTGYSNFAYLADLPLAGLKMDRCFTKAMGTLSPASYAVEAICAMAKALKLPLVAEGVETELQASAMHRLVPEAVGQGWLLGRPCKSDSLPDDEPGSPNSGCPAPA
jgi:sensor c-di-GMP phosphodiesterase-like protein